MKSLLQIAFVLSIGLLSACASNNYSEKNVTSRFRAPSSEFKGYETAQLNKAYDSEMTATANLTQEQIEANHFNDFKNILSARPFLKTQTINNAKDLSNRPEEFCAAYHSGYLLPDGATWVMSNFTISGSPSCDYSIKDRLSGGSGQFQCQVGVTATCTAQKH